MAVCACAANFSGEWTGTGMVNNTQRPFYFIFWVDGVTLNGSGGSDIDNQDVIRNGKIDGDRISFDLVPVTKPQYHFDLSAHGPDLTGTFQTQEGKDTITGTVRLKRPA
jgi:hypothetical protein